MDILILDDKSGTGNLLSDHLKTLDNCFSSTVTSAPMAKDHISRHKIDLLITDIDLKENENGIDIAYYYMSINRNGKVIIYTGYNKDDLKEKDQLRIFHLSPVGFYYGMPLNFAKVVEKVKEILFCNGAVETTDVQDNRDEWKDASHQLEIHNTTQDGRLNALEDRMGKIEETIKEEFTKSNKKQNVQQLLTGIIGFVIAVITFFGMIIK